MLILTILTHSFQQNKKVKLKLKLRVQIKTVLLVYSIILGLPARSILYYIGTQYRDFFFKS